MTAAMLHAFNHMLFKSLLFFAAGAVLTATGARDLNRLGGLFDRMRWTRISALIGCAAIAGAAAAQRLRIGMADAAGRAARPRLSAMDAETADAGDGRGRSRWSRRWPRPPSPALSASPFSAGRARRKPRARRDVDAPSRYAMAGLALACLLAGIFPGLLIDALKPLAEATVGASMPLQAKIAWTSIAPIAEVAQLLQRPAGVRVLPHVGLAWRPFAIHRFASAELRRAPAWDCGFPNADPATQYTAQSFASPFGASTAASPSPPRDRRHAPARRRARGAVDACICSDRVWRGVYAPLGAAVEATATRLNPLQFLTIRQYLSVVFARAALCC